MERHFDQDVRQLKDKLIRMGTLAEQMIGRAIHSILTPQQDMETVIKQEENMVNDLQIEIDETVVRLLALQHPVAHDLRFLLMASKIANELERVADLAINASQSSNFLASGETRPLPPELLIMADLARQMVRESLDALIHEDAQLARKILSTDDQVDNYKRGILQSTIVIMQANPGLVNWGVSLILISRSLERIGDYATNIAEEVIYLAEAREIRHHHEKKSPGQE